MDPRDAFVAQLTGNQNHLYAYILSLLGDPTAADDLLQTVNLTLWREMEDWDPDTSFMAWAMTVSRYEVLTWRKRQSRERLIFSDYTLDKVEATNESRNAEFEPRQAALIECLSELSQRFRELLRKRYTSGTPVHVMAEEVDSTPNAIAQALHRARRALARCMHSKLAEELSP